jgi:hypothetical protein
MPLADKTLQEFLSLGVKGYCAKHHLQCCDMCNDQECCDNTNPLIIKLKRTEHLLADALRLGQTLTDLASKALKNIQE